MQALLEAIAAAPWSAEATRLFHGRGGRHPGAEHLALDAYPPVWLVTSFAPLGEAEVAALDAAIAARWAQVAPAGTPVAWVLQQRGVAEAGQGGRVQTQVLRGAVPTPHVVTEDGLRFEVQLPRGQNHGLFLDMAEGRRWVRQWARHRPGGRVLNLFAYSCGFSVAALAGGAASVVNVDMSAGALALGRANHRLNGLPDSAAAGAAFLAHDLFSSWGKVTRLGPYDLVVADPPSYQKGSFVATKDYARVLRRLPELLAPGGQALLCLNAPELPEAFLREALAKEAPSLPVRGRLPNPPAFADVSPDRALKVLVVGGDAAG